ncbi:MAG: hypothetical protein J6X02_00095 [Bacilli bacterium]|nr:hypothetical protein [Bacilli bacterium]
MSKKIGNAIIILLQIISLIGLIVVIYLLYKAYTEEERVVRDDFTFTYLDEHGLAEEEIKVTVKKQEFVIKHVGEKTVINNKEIDFFATKVYVTNSIIILATAGQQGEILQFYNTDLVKIYDSDTMQFSELNLVNGKLTGSAINSTYLAIEGYNIENVWIVPCSEEVDTKISKYKNTIAKHEKELLEADYVFSYDTELIIEMPKRETIGSLFMKDIEENGGKYCIVIKQDNV